MTYEKYLEGLGAKPTFYSHIWESHNSFYHGSYTLWIKNISNNKRMFMLDIDLIYTHEIDVPYDYHIIVRMSFLESGQRGQRYYSLEHKGNRPTDLEMQSYIERMIKIFHVSDGEPFYINGNRIDN